MRLKAAIFIALLSFALTPSFGQNTPVKVERSQERVTKEGITFYVHKVEKGQTIFSICKTYEVTTEVLLEDNPILISGLKEGSTILVREGSEKPIAFIKHVVRWYDSISSLAKRYNVSEKDIRKVNSLNDGRLVVRQLLLIPDSTGTLTTVSDVKPATVVKDDKPAEELEKKYSVTKEVADALATSQKKTEKENTKTRNTNYKDFKFNVSLVLPLGSNKSEIGEMDENFLDFYEGFLLAVEDMKNMGMNLDLQVLDMHDYPNGQILAQSGKLDKSNLIIGPIFEKEIIPVLEHTERQNIPVVSPMDPKTESLVANHPGFYQINTSQYNLQKALIGSIPGGNHVTVIYDESGKDKELVEMTRRILTELGITYNAISYGVLSGRGMTPKIGAKLSSSANNAVVVPSNSEAFVSDALRNLNLLKTMNGFNISIYGTSTWRTFVSVDINSYHMMNLHIAIQHYIDYGNQDVKRFLFRYRALYGCEPNPYAFQAYDVARYFLEQLYVYGPEFSQLPESSGRELLQSDFKFEKKGSSNGFMNTATRVIVYNPDYSVNISRPEF